MTTLMIGLRKLKWVIHSVVNNIFIMVFHKDPFLVPCYLILIFVICFLLTSLLALQIMLMTPILTNVTNTVII